MPRLPGEINRAIGESNPEEKWLGEEGILHRIGLNNERYFAKQWRGKHYEGEHSGLSVTYDEKGGRTPVSPFWHKVKFWESKLIHAAFPDQTLEMPIGYDPRITAGGEDGPRFTYTAGRPVTLTSEVRGDAKLREERDQIIRRAYDKIWASREPNQDGVMRTKQESGAFYESDQEMAKRFGQELALPIVSHDNDLKKWVQKNIKNLQTWAPKSGMIELLEAGLIPIHAGVNFIPTAESDPERGPQGVYLELAIGDIELLRKKLYEPCGVDAYCRKNVDERIERYLMYRMIDDLYDDAFSEQYWLVHTTHPMVDSEVVQRGFEVCRAVQERIEREGVTYTAQWLPDIRKRLKDVTYRFSKKDETLAELDRIRAMVEEGSDFERRKAA